MECLNFPAGVKEQLYKLASISLCPNLSGQICMVRRLPTWAGAGRAECHACWPPSACAPNLFGQTCMVRPRAPAGNVPAPACRCAGPRPGRPPAAARPCPAGADHGPSAAWQALCSLLTFLPRPAAPAGADHEPAAAGGPQLRAVRAGAGRDPGGVGGACRCCSALCMVLGSGCACGGGGGTRSWTDPAWALLLAFPAAACLPPRGGNAGCCAAPACPPAPATRSTHAMPPTHPADRRVDVQSLKRRAQMVVSTFRGMEGVSCNDGAWGRGAGAEGGAVRNKRGRHGGHGLHRRRAAPRAEARRWPSRAAAARVDQARHRAPRAALAPSAGAPPPAHARACCSHARPPARPNPHLPPSPPRPPAPPQWRAPCMRSRAWSCRRARRRRRRRRGASPTSCTAWSCWTRLAS